MAEPSGNDRLFCWEQVARVNPLFRISRVFAPNGLSERLLPLYALFAALEQLCAQESEAEIKRHKLDWWRSECLDRRLTESGHPILRELSRSGTARHLDRNVLAQLFDSTELRLDGPAPVDVEEFDALCRMTGSPQCTLEFAMTANGRDVQAPATAACLGLAQLLRESTGQGASRKFWWLPLNLLARHGISRGDLERDVDGPPARALFTETLQRGSSWLTESSREVEHAAGGPANIRHLAVHAQLQAFVVQRLTGGRPSEYQAAVRRAGWGGLLQAWRAARNVNRR